MKTILTIITIIFLTGCMIYTAKQPGAGVDPDFALTWACDYDEVMEKAEQYKARLSGRRVYVPQPGWDSCDLLARNGRPNKFNMQTTANNRYATWWYGSGSNLWMISLKREAATSEYRRGRWIVTYVGT